MNATALHSQVEADAAYRDEWRAFEQDPGPLVFLLGCQRSGTTWLHLQLARSGAFRFLSAFEVQAAERLVHLERQGQGAAARAAFAASLQAAARDRGIDSIPAGPDTPEEYGLAIGDGTLRYGRPDTNAETLPRLRELCAKKALLEGRERPLLLKSPPDYPGAVPLLADTWPDARFVAIQRHPLYTLQSQLRAWRELLKQRNPYVALIDPGYRAFFEDGRRRLQLGLFLQSPAGVEALADSILQAQLGFLALLDTWRGHESCLLRYEDLCTDQAGTFARLARSLGLTLPAPAQAPAPREANVSEEVRRAFAARREAFAPYLERFGYDGEPA